MRLLPGLLATVAAPMLAAAAATDTPPRGPHDYREQFETPYQTLIVERRGNIVDLRTPSPSWGEAIHSSVNLDDPLQLWHAYARVLYGALYFQPQPRRVLMIGLGGASFHRLFAAAYPEALLQSVELDPKVLELCRERMAFTPAAQTPVAVMDGRVFIRKNREVWDWLILDAYRGETVPPHLKTAEFYRECAARLAPGGVLVANLHAHTELYYADLRTLREVFPQVVLIYCGVGSSVIAFAVNSAAPDLSDPVRWPDPATLANPFFGGRLDLADLRRYVVPLPEEKMAQAPVLTDDHAPVEHLHSRKIPPAEWPRPRFLPEGN